MAQKGGTQSYENRQKFSFHQVLVWLYFAKTIAFYFAFSFQLVKPKNSSGIHLIIHIIGFSVMLLTLLYCSLKDSFNSRAYAKARNLPLKTPKWKAIVKSGFSSEPESSARVENKNLPQDTEQNAQPEEDSQYEFFCLDCSVGVDASTKHCNRCGVCIEGFDHHCVWLNLCIGKKNYKSFVFLVVLAFGVILYEILFQSLVVLPAIKLEKHGFSKDSRKNKKIGLIINIVVDGLIDFLLLQLILFHVYIGIKGITTYQYLTRNKVEQSKKVDNYDGFSRKELDGDSQASRKDSSLNRSKDQERSQHAFGFSSEQAHLRKNEGELQNPNLSEEKSTELRRESELEAKTQTVREKESVGMMTETNSKSLFKNKKTEELQLKSPEFYMTEGKHKRERLRETMLPTKLASLKRKENGFDSPKAISASSQKGSEKQPKVFLGRKEQISKTNVDNQEPSHEQNSQYMESNFKDMHNSSQSKPSNSSVSSESLNNSQELRDEIKNQLENLQALRKK